MNYKKLIFSLAVPLLVGGISVLITRNSIEAFESLIKPPFAPPAWIFGPVWTVLYLLMGISLYRVLKEKDSDIQKALILFGVQLFLNFIWSPVFFIFNLRLLAFIIILILIVFVILTAKNFYKVDKLSGLLFIPYIIWLVFASILNLSIYLLNR
ncbi:TspO/MBR family protein [Caloramator sp. CAR-1]|uniref:TspO/MBR family protein n=1 Tax=Caloramator sp. CAR-1 TaxID=3062777 RepID=UPI0026E3994E|nr:TspO/MBR family protein [Caloramator sp. CAR-1]MDO6354057.1 TspO/MBR family protein [Caloramator sp. CAR-1]